MRFLISLIIVSQLLIGCKQEATFSALDSTERPISETGNDSEIVGPLVKIVKAPEDKLINEENEVVFEVIQGSYEIEKVICSINNFSLPCDWFKGILKIVGLPLGKYIFKVEVQDIKGLKNEALGNWKVYDRFKKLKDQLNVEKNQKKSDILFVIDNSTSMKYEQTKISQRFDKFIDQIQGLDWQIAITTTDSNSNKTWGDGKLVAFENGQYFLKPDLGLNLAQKLFAQTVQRKETGSDIEMGIYGTYRSLERSINPTSSLDQEHSRFFRSDSALSVVVVSDEDESANSIKNKAENLIKLIEKKWSKNKIFQFNSIIAYTNQCLSTKGMTYGRAYENLTKSTGGILGDICADNYSKILKELGQGVVNLHKSYSLKCEPQDIDKDGIIDLSIKSKTSLPIPNYTLDKNKIEFDDGLKSGDYEFEYFCLD
jgi:hypothetical protein